MADAQLTQLVISWEQRKVAADGAWQKIVGDFKSVYDQAAQRQISREQYDSSKADYDGKKAQYEDFLRRYEEFYAQHPGLREEIEQTKAAVAQGAPRPDAPPPATTSSYEQQIEHDAPKERAPIQYRPEDRQTPGASIAPEGKDENEFTLDRRKAAILGVAVLVLVGAGIWLVMGLFGGDEPAPAKPKPKPVSAVQLKITDESMNTTAAALSINAASQPAAEAANVAGNLFSADGLVAAKVSDATYFKLTSPQAATNIVSGVLKDEKAAATVVEKTKVLIKPPVTALPAIKIKGATVVGLIDKGCLTTTIQAKRQLVSVITTGPAGTCAAPASTALLLQHKAIIDDISKLAD